MKKTNRIFAVLTMIAMLAIPMGGLLAVMPVVGSDTAALPTGYKSFAGTIVDIGDGAEVIIMLEGADEEKAAFVITDGTYVYDGVELALGEQLVGFFDLSLPAPAIFPPRYIASVISKAGGPETVFVGIFDENLLSSDNALKLNVGEDTVVVDSSGAAFDGDLSGKHLAVTYAISTMSLPPQALALHIVVLEADEAVAEKTAEFIKGRRSAPDGNTAEKASFTGKH